ncbi:alpha/beta fold hydrolase [Candidatus Sumerlaeota bacterium]|nr:alpha/beta fold hydrolase [Candidatus Sumerlaeota bacterium]
MHYVDEGAGDPVVMVHGNPTWSFYYRNVIQALRGSHRCIAMDHIGMGLSDKPDDGQYDYRLARRIGDLDALMEHCGVKENVTLIVHDWGGAIGLGWAARHPERIQRIVILNTSAFHKPPEKPMPWTLRLSRTPLGAVMIRGFNAFCRYAVKHCVTRRPLDSTARRGLLLPYDSWANRIAVLRFVQDIPLWPGDPSYDTVSEVEREVTKRFRATPMLICWGMRDFVFDHHFLKQFECAFPLAQIHCFEDCGHYILEDAQKETLDLIEGFMR